MIDRFSEEPLSGPRVRLLTSSGAALVGTIISCGLLRQRGYLGSDFNWMWGAARHLLSGHDPYHNPRFVLFFFPALGLDLRQEFQDLAGHFRWPGPAPTPGGSPILEMRSVPGLT